MSGSSRASHTFTRCVVTLDAGLSISWTPDADGSFEHGSRHHQKEEAGHVFTAPAEPAFRDAQRGAHGMLEMCEVQLRCVPALSEAALAALAERISKLISA